ncbi:MAG: hypothetical protein QOJ27_466 [Sphingomonadales bacterium]|jgi:hypothetical protein|nr:hypothetical protein [Sphingomonadales bacterium]
MRGSLILLAPALLVACDSKKPAIPEEPGVNVAAPLVVQPPARPAPAVPAKASPVAALDGIPPTFLGTWDASAEACVRPSDQRLMVMPRELRFHESIGRVYRVVGVGANTIRVAANYQGEGESWRATQLFRLGGNGGTLAITVDNGWVVRVRCPAGPG